VDDVYFEWGGTEVHMRNKLGSETRSVFTHLTFSREKMSGVLVTGSNDGLGKLAAPLLLSRDTVWCYVLRTLRALKKLLQQCRERKAPLWES
jgi:hypothetical protein